MKFRPCIDLHNGKVKQIVGSTLSDDVRAAPETNFETEKPSEEFANMYKAASLSGGHVIMLGPHNELAAKRAVAAYPGGMQVGGGITAGNAREYLEAGASHVIVTSYIFQNGQLQWARLRELVDCVGREHLVIDLSCRRKQLTSSPSLSSSSYGTTALPLASTSSSSSSPSSSSTSEQDDPYWVVMDRWQTFTDYSLSAPHLSELAQHCDEFLVHGVEVEGKRLGILQDLVVKLGQWSPIPVTYAGGVRTIEDLELVKTLGAGRVDVSVGSALDIFGGNLSYAEVVAWHQQQQQRL